MNQDGKSYQENSLDVGELSIQVTVLAKSKTELEMLKDKIRNVLNPKLGQATVISDSGFRKRKLEVVASEMPFFSVKSNVEEICLINCIAHDPYWKDISETKVEIAKWQPNFEFPLEIPATGLEIGYREPSLIVNVNNKGQVPTGMKVQFKALGTVVNPSLFDINNQTYFKINKIMEQDDILEVTTGFQNKRVKLIKQGVTTTYHDWDYTSTWLQLAQGDNLYRYNADDGIDSLECSIHFTNKYLGE